MARDDQPRAFSRAQEKQIKRWIAGAVIAARIIDPKDCTPATMTAIRRAIEAA